MATAQTSISIRQSVSNVLAVNHIKDNVIITEFIPKEDVLRVVVTSKELPGGEFVFHIEIVYKSQLPNTEVENATSPQADFIAKWYRGIL